MTNIYTVRYSDLDMDGILCAFTSKEEAKRYELALEAEKDEDDSPHLHFYTSEITLYNKCEEVEQNG